MKNKKAKPKNRPVSARQIQQAIEQTADRVFFDEWTILFTIMRDKWGWGGKRLRRVWDMCNDVCNSISDGNTDFADILSEVKELTGIQFPYWQVPTLEKPKNALQLRRALNARRRAAEDFSWCIFLYILHKSEGFGTVRLNRIHNSHLMIHEAIQQRYVTIDDLRQTLQDEGHIEISQR